MQPISAHDDVFFQLRAMELRFMMALTKIAYTAYCQAQCSFSDIDVVIDARASQIPINFPLELLPEATSNFDLTLSR